MNTPDDGRFEPYILQPGAPSAFGCFGTWENAKTCQPIGETIDPLDGCSQSVECRQFTLEQNPPTTRFRVKPRRDGRFELQQFRDFIQDQSSYHMEIHPGRIVITFPGSRAVPKSKRFFLHVKHVEEALLAIEGEFELVMSLEEMILRQAVGDAAAPRALRARKEEEDPGARRRRIAENLRKRASEQARAGDDDEEAELDIDIDIDIDEDDLDDDDIDIEVVDDDDDDDDIDAVAVDDEETEIIVGPDDEAGDGEDDDEDEEEDD